MKAEHNQFENKKTAIQAKNIPLFFNDYSKFELKTC